MSYDLYFFRPRTDRPIEEVRVLLDDEEAELGRGEPPSRDDGSEADREALAAAFLSVNPRLERFVPDHAEIARSLGTTEEEARRAFRHIELNEPELETGLQIMVNDRYASLTVPYWHDGPEARAVFDEIGRFVDRLEEDGYVAYDPQSDSVLRSGDLPDALGTYRGVSSRMEEIMEQAKTAVEPEPTPSLPVSLEPPPARPAAPKKPWWKFW